MAEYVVLLALVAISAMAGYRMFASSTQSSIDVQGDRILAMQGATPNAPAAPKGGTSKPGGVAKAKSGIASKSPTAKTTTPPVQPVTTTTPPPAAPDLGPPGERLRLAQQIARAGGSADAADVALVVAELAKLPLPALQRLANQGTRVVVARGSVTDYKTALRGVRPRGWPPGSTWDNVPGLYDPNTNEVVVAVIGHGTPAGPRIPRSGEGHGSYNLVIHEVFHAVDRGNSQSSGPAFRAARQKDINSLSPYERQTGEAGLQESYAEIAARYFGGDPTFRARFPNLFDYWQSNPLSLPPPARRP